MPLQKRTSIIYYIVLRLGEILLELSRRHEAIGLQQNDSLELHCSGNLDTYKVPTKRKKRGPRRAEPPGWESLFEEPWLDTSLCNYPLFGIHQIPFPSIQLRCFSY